MLNHVVAFILGFGLPGIFFLAVLDSTFLFYLPLAMDTLFILLVSHHRSLTPILIILIISGSLVGAAITYAILGRSKVHVLDRIVSGDKMKKLKKRIEEKGFWAISIAAILPPPFPFTPFLAAASATKISFKKLLLSVFVGRTVRYILEAVLALLFGRMILMWIKNPVFQIIVFAIFVLALIGSIISVVRWTRMRRSN
jgi:membrane protein YqaA with SNARE-associated domain